MQQMQLELTGQFQSHNVPGNIPIYRESSGMDPKCPQPGTIEIGNPRQSVQFNQQGGYFPLGMAHVNMAYMECRDTRDMAKTVTFQCPRKIRLLLITPSLCHARAKHHPE